MSQIKNLSPRLAYMRGYHRGRSTGKERGIEAALDAVIEHQNTRPFQMDLIFARFTEDQKLELIKKI